MNQKERKEVKREFTFDLLGRKLIIETGHLAQLANGSCLVRYGDTVVLSTATSSKEPRPGVDFFPLSVDYEEKMYALGKFPGGFMKREGRPSENAILTSRAIDRPLRPLFPKDLRNDVHVNNLVMSVDQDCEPELAAMIGSSIAVAISDIPWAGPTAAVALGLVDGEIVVNPNAKEREISDMYVTLAGTEDKVCMIEAGANEVPDELMLEAITEGHKVISDICRFIKSIVAEIGLPKYTYTSSAVPATLLDECRALVIDQLKTCVLTTDKTQRDNAVDALTDKIKEHFADDEAKQALAAEIMYNLEKEVVRSYLYAEKRVDGRDFYTIRPLSCGVDLLPRAHGSAWFERGQTQVVTVCTLASLANAQTIDNLSTDTEKRYIHQYNFPGYSTGEAKASRSPGRREIGHGALAERALVAVLPSKEEFPYAIRNVSEVMSSNGSTSQGSVCASTLALMAAGVPIKRPVAGISCGLITAKDDISDYKVFMDIQGIEDFFGDMDFKVAGTTEGITAIQVDIKVKGLSLDIIRDAFAMTKRGRLQIINDIILPCISAPRTELSTWAPKIYQTEIPVDKIGEVVGKSGKTINRIISLTNSTIDIDESGHVYVSCLDEEKGRNAIKMIEGIVKEPVVGEIYEGTVTRLMSFGAFVEYLPGKEGMVHISKVAMERIDNIEDVVQVGDTVQVKIIEVDEQGRVNLSMRDCLPGAENLPQRNERRTTRPSFNERPNFRNRENERSERNEHYERNNRGTRFNRDRRENNHDNAYGLSRERHNFNQFEAKPRRRKFDVDVDGE